MLIPNKNISHYNKAVWIIFAVFTASCIMFGLYVYTEKQVNAANEERKYAHELIHEMRQSSDDLTRMARTYVVTRDPIYKRHFQEILDIRDGLAAHPINYDHIYWDLVLADDKRPRPNTPPMALMEKISKAGFTYEEFEKLSLAKQYSDELALSEYAAMYLVEADNEDAKANRTKAYDMLFDANYHKTKYKIMKALSDFSDMAEDRTDASVQRAEIVAMLVRLLFITLSLILVFLLWRISRLLQNVLGGSLTQIYSLISDIGVKNYNTTFTLPNESEHTILGKLVQTQTHLAKLENEFLNEQQKSQHYLDIVSVIILVLDTDKNVKLINKYGCEIIGYTEDEVAGKNWIENFIPEKYRHALNEVVDSLIMPNKVPIRAFENLVLTKSGEERLIAWRNTSLYDEDGQITGILTSGEDITDRRKAENALIESEQHLDSIIQTEPECVKIVDNRGQLIQMNPAGLAMLEALTLEEAQQYGLVDYVLPEYRAGFIALHHKVMGGESGTFEFEVTGLRGTRRWLETHATPMRNAKGEVTSLLGVTRDITQRKSNESALVIQTQAMEQSPNAVIITDFKANIEYVNTAFIQNTGYTFEEVIGENPRLLQSGITPEHAYDEMWTALVKQEKWQGEFINKRKDGTNYIYSINIAPVIDIQGKTTHYIAIEEDISEQKKIQEKIHYLANYDALTGLPNRIQMDDHLQYTLNLAKRNEGKFALIFLDLDHFKSINDTLGHTTGDLLLIELSKRLSNSLRDEDTVSRMGGDEFVLLLPQTDANGAAQVAQKVLESIAVQFHLEDHELSVTASLGIALYPSDGTDIETLSKNADIAMYRAKQEGRNAYCFFTQEMQKNSQRNLELSNALHVALERNEFHLVYQPQLSAKDATVIGAEALIRWEHPQLGLVSPAEFIPIAEDNGTILSIGEWVLRTAVFQAAQWNQNGMTLIMAVNLSAVQFRHPSLPSLITDILEEAGLHPKYLELELTEGVAMYDPQGAINVMNTLHEIGIRMSIDDFGTGYSSLSYLKQFKVYKLKIDQSFVRDISTDPEDKAIVNAVIQLAHSLDLITIAEGVETLDQLKYLQEQKCDEIQGYYYSKPVLAIMFEEVYTLHQKKPIV